VYKILGALRKHKLYHEENHNIKKAPIGSYKVLFIKGIMMIKKYLLTFFNI